MSDPTDFSHDIDVLLRLNKTIRDETIEECAKVAEELSDPDAVSVSVLGVRIAAAIRALKTSQ